MEDDKEKVGEAEDETELINFKTLQEALDKFKNNWDTFTNATSALTSRNIIPESMNENI